MKEPPAPPYRAMPPPETLPASPGWRSWVRRGLVLFNVLVLVLLCAAVVHWLRVGDPYDVVAVYVSVVSAAPASLALLGLLGRGRRSLRSRLLLPSGLLWALGGFFVAFAALTGLFLHRLSAAAIERAGPWILVGITLFAVGFLTVDAHSEWLRQSKELARRLASGREKPS